MHVTRWMLFGSLLLLGAMLPTWAGSESWMPLRAGAEWTYAVKGEKPGVLKMRVSGPMKNGCWPLAVGDGQMQARLNENGVQLLAETRVGVAARPAMVTVADLRWNGAETWQAQSASGCMVFTIEGRRGATETVEVPAGRFECVKITNKGMVTDTWWLARGVGVVKRLKEQPDGRVEWALQSHR